MVCRRTIFLIGGSFEVWKPDFCLNNGENMKEIMSIISLVIILSVCGGCAKVGPRVQHTLSKAAYDRGDLDKAIFHAEKGMEVAKKGMGEKNPETLTLMNNAGFLYSKNGLYDKAEDLHLQTLSLRREVLGDRHPDTLTSMNNLADVYQKQGKLVKAGELFSETLSLREEILGLHHPQTLNAMGNLAHLSAKRGEFETSVKLYSRTLQLRKETLGELHLETLSTLTALASVHQEKGDYGTAADLFTQAMGAYKESLGDRHERYLECKNNLAMAYFGQGWNKRAEVELNETLHQYNEILGEHHPNTLRVMDNLGTVYRVSGKFDQAEELLQKVLVLRVDSLGKGHLDTLVTINNLALLYQAMGLYDKAEMHYSEVLTGRRARLGSNSPDTAVALHNLAFLYTAQGRVVEARDYYTESLDVLTSTVGEKHPDTLHAMANLANLYLDMGDLKVAEELIPKVLRLRTEALGEHHPDTILSLNSYSMLQMELHGDQQAVETAEKVVDASILAYGMEHPTTLVAKNNLAFLYQHFNRFNQAETLYKEVLKSRLRVLGEVHPDTLLSRFNVAELYLETGRNGLAFEQLKKHFHSSNAYLQKIIWGAGEDTRQAYIDQQHDERNLYLSLFSQLSTDASLVEFWNVSLTRKGRLQSIASQVIAITNMLKNEDPELKDILARFNEARSALASLTFTETDSWRDRETLRKELNELERLLGAKAKEQQAVDEEIRPETVQSALGGDEVLIDFLIFNKVNLKQLDTEARQIYAVVVAPGEKLRLIHLGPLRPVTSLVKNYRKTMNPTSGGSRGFQSNERRQTLEKAAKDLHDLLWRPLQPFLAGKNKVFLVPDGILNLLPFKALLDDEGDYLLNTYSIVRLNSARDLIKKKQQVSIGESAVFSNPDYINTLDQTPGVTRGIAIKTSELWFTPLPGTAAEGEQVMALMQGGKRSVKLFTQQVARESSLMALDSPPILHLATHGYYLEDISRNKGLGAQHSIQRLDSGKLGVANVENPLARSGLALYNANLGVRGQKLTDGTDGLLSALEVLNLKLAGTQLVVLSACETGVGEVQTGEGVYSLNRAFQEAGAKSVLSTLWPISDQGTMRLMEDFYSRVLDDISPQQALQLSQQDFQKDELFRDPFFWAPFVMVGL